MGEKSNRIDADILAIKRTIDQNYDKFKYAGVFYLEKNEVLAKILSEPDDTIAKIAAECREGGVRWRMFPKVLNKVESALLNGAEVVDCSTSPECGIASVCGVPTAEWIKIIEKPDGVAVSFGVSGTFDCLMKANRNGRFSVRAMAVTPETEFTLVNELTPFWEDRYSIALKSAATSFALSAEDSKTGKKGSAAIKLTVLENGRLVIDDLAKYTDTTPLLRWINP